MTICEEQQNCFAVAPEIAGLRSIVQAKPADNGVLPPIRKNQEPAVRVKYFAKEAEQLRLLFREKKLRRRDLDSGMTAAEASGLTPSLEQCDSQPYCPSIDREYEESSLFVLESL
jgi:hypothetical protein